MAEKTPKSPSLPPSRKSILPAKDISGGVTLDDVRGLVKEIQKKYPETTAGSLRRELKSTLAQLQAEGKKPGTDKSRRPITNTRDFTRALASANVLSLPAVLDRFDDLSLRQTEVTEALINNQEALYDVAETVATSTLPLVQVVDTLEAQQKNIMQVATGIQTLVKTEREELENDKKVVNSLSQIETIESAQRKSLDSIERTSKEAYRQDTTFYKRFGEWIERQDRNNMFGPLAPSGGVSSKGWVRTLGDAFWSGFGEKFGAIGTTFTRMGDNLVEFSRRYEQAQQRRESDGGSPFDLRNLGGPIAALGGLITIITTFGKKFDKMPGLAKLGSSFLRGFLVIDILVSAFGYLVANGDRAKAMMNSLASLGKGIVDLTAALAKLAAPFLVVLQGAISVLGFVLVETLIPVLDVLGQKLQHWALLIDQITPLVWKGLDAVSSTLVWLTNKFFEGVDNWKKAGVALMADIQWLMDTVSGTVTNIGDKWNNGVNSVKEASSLALKSIPLLFSYITDLFTTKLDQIWSSIDPEGALRNSVKGLFEMLDNAIRSVMRGAIEWIPFITDQQRLDLKKEAGLLTTREQLMLNGQSYTNQDTKAPRRTTTRTAEDILADISAAQAVIDLNNSYGWFGQIAGTLTGELQTANEQIDRLRTELSDYIKANPNESVFDFTNPSTFVPLISPNSDYQAVPEMSTQQEIRQSVPNLSIYAPSQTTNVNGGGGSGNISIPRYVPNPSAPQSKYDPMIFGQGMSLVR